MKVDEVSRTLLTEAFSCSLESYDFFLNPEKRNMAYIATAMRQFTVMSGTDEFF